MKKLLLGIFITIFLLPFYFISAQNQSGYSLTATSKNSTITITLNSPPLSPKTVQPIVSEAKITTIPSNTSSPIPSIGEGLEQKSINPTGKTEWTVQLKANSTYYIRIIETTGQTKSFLTNEVTVKTGGVGDIYFNEPKFQKISTGMFTLSGSIDKTKHKETDPILLSTISVSAGFYDKKTTDLIFQLNPAKPNESGAYEFLINNSNFNQNTFYDLKMSFDSTNGGHNEHAYTVDTGKGYIIPESGKARDDFFDKNSYRLLAPIPGMVALLDPALCQLEQTRNPGQICDINAFLNFLLSLAIGAAAVVLVVRIIISGYGYMVSDIPFVKAKLKGNFIEALIGLLVALSAYLILNTVNPKLVSNDVKIGVVEFEVIKYVDIDIPEGGDLTEPISNNGSTPGFNCASGSKTNGFCMFGTIDKPKPTGQIPELIRFLESGYKLTLIRIYPNDRIFFTAEKGSDRKQFSTNGIGHGANGWAELGKGKEGDKKTPYGSYKIDRPPRKAPNQNTVMRSTRKDKNGVGYSMGGAVFNLNSRGIAIHSNNKNSQGNTAACILMYNDDLFALYPYIWVGLPVVIGP
ncbi:L,D-transpeptidase [Candidatus Nomurabacteria bacterium]|nr:L,D-transpeptidase [Candidatus Nomurabacteria bacterium]